MCVGGGGRSGCVCYSNDDFIGLVKMVSLLCVMGSSFFYFNYIYYYCSRRNSV